MYVDFLRGSTGASQTANHPAQRQQRWLLGGVVVLAIEAGIYVDLLNRESAFTQRTDKIASIRAETPSTSSEATISLSPQFFIAVESATQTLRNHESASDLKTSGKIQLDKLEFNARMQRYVVRGTAPSLHAVERWTEQLIAAAPQFRVLQSVVDHRPSERLTFEVALGAAPHGTNRPLKP